MPENYHGWTIAHQKPEKGSKVHTLVATSPRDKVTIEATSAEIDDTMDLEVMLKYMRLDIALTEFNRTKGTEQQAWAKRLAQAARDEKEQRISRRLARLAGSEESDEDLITRLTGAKIRMKGN